MKMSLVGAGFVGRGGKLGDEFIAAIGNYVGKNVVAELFDQLDKINRCVGISCRVNFYVARLVD